MHREGCKPNVVTYNSLIAACAQGLPPLCDVLLFDPPVSLHPMFPAPIFQSWQYCHLSLPPCCAQGLPPFCDVLLFNPPVPPDPSPAPAIPSLATLSPLTPSLLAVLKVWFLSVMCLWSAPLFLSPSLLLAALAPILPPWLPVLKLYLLSVLAFQQACFVIAFLTKHKSRPPTDPIAALPLSPSHTHLQGPLCSHTTPRLEMLPNTPAPQTHSPPHPLHTPPNTPLTPPTPLPFHKVLTCKSIFGVYMVQAHSGRRQWSCLSRCRPRAASRTR